VKYARILVKDYPDLNNQTFTYTIPEHLEDKVFVGSRVVVPFGLKGTLRLGYVLKITGSETESLSYKDIYSVASIGSLISESQIRFLEFVSLYFFIPLANLFELAHLFPEEEKIKKFYQVNTANLDKIGRIRNKEKVLKYLLSHKNGFSEELFRKRFKLRKNSSILQTLEKKSVISSKLILKEENVKEEKTRNFFTPGVIKLLNGVSFNERVEEYKRLIWEEKAKNVLIITPNVYILKAIKDKLSKIFGDSEVKIIYGSKFSILELKENFDLIIIEDITNSEYKIDKPLDFDLEKTASIRAMELGGKIILGSFIPTIASFQSLKNGKIECINRDQKEVNKVAKPEIKILDLRKEIIEHGYFDIPVSIQKEIKKMLSKGKKSLIFINRKGYYNLLICKKCGYVVKCPICSVPLIYHIDRNKLVCKYCGYQEDEFYICPSCGGISIRYASAGTERFEKKAQQLFRKVNVLRIDREIYDNKELKNIPDFQIAIGTSLSLSFLDFSDIDTVIVMGIDSLLNMPSFNAYEETLYLIMRIYERLIGENEKKLIIPTFTPHSELFSAIREGEDEKLTNFYVSELSERKKLRYPPFCDFFQIDLESTSKENLPAKTEKLSERIRSIKNIEVVNIKPLLSRSPYGIYRGRIIIKSKNILNERKNLGIILDSIRKEEKVNVKVKSLG
jgi:primosomal protein N' (replication factor Y)